MADGEAPVAPAVPPSMPPPSLDVDKDEEHAVVEGHSEDAAIGALQVGEGLFGRKCRDAYNARLASADGSAFDQLLGWMRTPEAEAYRITADDTRAFLSLFRPHKEDPKRRLPMEVRCQLLSAFREHMVAAADPHTPRSYFEFSGRGGFLQLPPLSLEEWNADSGYTFNAWIHPWSHRNPTQARVGQRSMALAQRLRQSSNSKLTLSPADTIFEVPSSRAVLYSMCTSSQHVGVEARLVETGDGAGTMLVEVRARLHGGEWIVVSGEVPVECMAQKSEAPGHWYMLSITHAPTPPPSSPFGGSRSSFVDPQLGKIVVHVNGTACFERSLVYPLLPAAINAETGTFSNCQLGSGFLGKIERLTLYAGSVEASALHMLFKCGMGFRYPPLSVRSTTPISLTLSCNRTVYENSYGLDVVWSYCAEDALAISSGVPGDSRRQCVPEWKTMGTLTLSRIVQDQWVRKTRRFATIMGNLVPHWGRATWAHSALFVAGGMKVITPLFAFLEGYERGATASPQSTASPKLEDKAPCDEGMEAMLLLRSLIHGSGGLRLRKELYEMRGAAVIASLLTETGGSVLTPSLLGAMFSATKLLVDADSPLGDDFLRYLLLDFDLWSRADVTVQVQLANLLHGFVAEHPGRLRQIITAQVLLDKIRLAYCRPPSTYAAAPKHMRLNPTETAKCVDSMTGLVEEIVISTMRVETEDNRSMAIALNALLGFVRSCSGSLPGKTAAARGLAVINALLDRHEYKLQVYKALQNLGGAAEIVPLVGRPGETARVAALGLMGRLLLISRHLAAAKHVDANTNESKPDLVLRLMSASLIELRGVDALETVNCKSNSTSLTPPPGRGEMPSSEDKADMVTPVKPEEGAAALPQNTASARKERTVSAATVAATIELVTGDWSKSLVREHEMLIVLPEALLLLLGLLTAPGIPIAMVDDTITRLSLWMKMNPDNSTQIISCVHWQRWFLGMYSSIYRKYREGVSNGISVTEKMVCNTVACLYSHLISRVKNGHQQLRATLTLLDTHEYTHDILLSLMTETSRRLHSDLSQMLRVQKTLSGVTIENAVCLFQMFDEYLFPERGKSAASTGENREELLVCMVKLFSILRQAGAMERKDGDFHQNGVGIIRVITRELPHVRPANVSPLLDCLQILSISCITALTTRTRSVMLRVIDTLQEAMIRFSGNGNPADVDKRSLSVLAQNPQQMIALSLLALVNNCNLGWDTLIEGWNAETTLAAIRPIPGETPIESAQRVFDLLAPALIREKTHLNNNPQDAVLVYQNPNLFVLASRTINDIVSRQVNISTRDVSELQSRQNTRSDLDQQRFVVYNKGVEVSRSQTYGFFHSRIWPALKMGVHNPWCADLSLRRYYILNDSEEHLFSRRRRRLTIDPFGDGHKTKSYATFARGYRGEDAPAEVQARDDLGNLLKSVSIVDAMKAGNAPGAEEAPQDDSVKQNESIDDGWTEEDNEWDVVAQERDAAARKAVRVRRASKSKRAGSTTSPSRSSLAAKRPSSHSGSDMGMSGIPETVVCRDDRVLLVRPTMSTEGSAVLTDRAIIFNPDASKPDEITGKATYNPADRKRRWRLENIRRMYLRRYCLVSCAFELFVSGGEVVFLVFKGKPEVKRRDTMYTMLYELLEPRVQRFSQPLGQSPRRFFDQSGLTRAWQNRALSNFDYIMALNTVAGRSYTDLSQYPVYPWVLTDFKSDSIDLSDPKVYRDLKLPVGALNPQRLQEFRHRYESFDDDQIPKFLYGSHYSTAAGVVLYYLVRLEPFTQLHVDTQDGHFDVPDRLFSSIAKTWEMCYTSLSEVKELTPEFFTFPNFLRNESSCPLGTMQDGLVVGDVELPPWANGSPETFIEVMRSALESEYVTEHLHHWIDLIFGYKQRGEAAVKNDNVFYYLTYEGTVDLDTIDDPTVRTAMELQIEHFGQCPTQLMITPHPPRGRHITVPRPLYLSLLGQYLALGDPLKHIGIIDLSAIHSAWPELASLVRLGFDPVHAMSTVERSTRDVRQCATKLAEGGQYTREKTFSDLRAVVYTSTAPEHNDGSDDDLMSFRKKEEKNQAAVVCVRALFDSVESVDANGQLVTFQIERQDPRSEDQAHRDFGDGFVPISVFRVPVAAKPQFSRSSTKGRGAKESFVIPSLVESSEFTLSESVTTWSSGGYILATAGAPHGGVELWALDRNQSGAMYVDGAMSVSGHEASVTTVVISREIILTGSADGMVMLWHLSKGANNLATLSNRPFQLLRGHSGTITSASLNKTCQTVVTVSEERRVLFHRLEQPPPNGQHEVVGDLPAMAGQVPAGTTIQHVVATAVGYVIAVENRAFLAAYDLNGRRVRENTAGTGGDVVAVEKDARGFIVITATRDTVALWSTKTLSLLKQYDVSVTGRGISSLSISLTEEFLVLGCDEGVVVIICMPQLRDASDPTAPKQSFRLKSRARATSEVVSAKAKTAVANAFSFFSKAFK